MSILANSAHRQVNRAMSRVQMLLQVLAGILAPRVARLHFCDISQNTSPLGYDTKRSLLTATRLACSIELLFRFFPCTICQLLEL